MTTAWRRIDIAWICISFAIWSNQIFFCESTETISFLSKSRWPLCFKTLSDFYTNKSCLHSIISCSLWCVKDAAQLLNRNSADLRLAGIVQHNRTNLWNFRWSPNLQLGISISELNSCLEEKNQLQQCNYNLSPYEKIESYTINSIPIMCYHQSMVHSDYSKAVLAVSLHKINSNLNHKYSHNIC